MPNVVPHVCHVLVGGERQGSLKAVQRHVVLLSVETAQAQIGEQLGIVHPHLKKTSTNIDKKICRYYIAPGHRNRYGGV